MVEPRRIAPEVYPAVDPIPVQTPLQAARPRDPLIPGAGVDWLSAGWRFGLGFMAAATIFAVLDGLVLYILADQGFHLSFGVPR